MFFFFCRARVARNYLSNAAPSLTPEDISLLSQYCNYQKVSNNPWRISEIEASGNKS